MTKQELQTEYNKLYNAYAAQTSYVRRLERERYHLRSIIMLQAVEDWLSEEEYDEQAVDDEQEPQRSEIKVKGFAPENNDTNVNMK